MTACYLFGHGSLGYQVAERLQRAGFQLIGCCSPDGSMAAWCNAANVRHWGSPDAFRAHLLETLTPIELFVNLDSSWPVETGIIERIRGDVIQFHPSLLPHYQGAHSATWAMLQGELWHGLTWQSLKRAARGDPSCLQKTLDIYPHDTIITLNSRLQEQALERLDALLPSLRQPQADSIDSEALTESCHLELNFVAADGPATRFEANARPATLGLLPLTQTATEVRNLVRALDYGPVLNPLTTAKLWLNDPSGAAPLFICVSKVEIGATSSQPAGTLVAIEQDQDRVKGQVKALQITSADRLLIVSGLRNCNGSPLTTEQLSTAGISAGHKLVLPSVAELKHLHTRSETMANWESELVARCAAFEPCFHPLTALSRSVSGKPSHRPPLSVRLGSESTDKESTETAIAAFALYWLRATQQTQTSIGVYVAANRSESDPTAGLETQLFMPHVPLPVSVETTPNSASAPSTIESFADFQHQLLIDLRHTDTLTLAQDAILRYPILNGFDATELGAVSVWLAEHPVNERQIAQYFTTPQRRLLLVADTDTTLYGAPDLDPLNFGRVVDQLKTLLNAAQANPESDPRQLVWVPPSEQRQLLDWGRGESLELPRQTITQVIAEIAKQFPQRPALVDYSGPCSYEALLKQSAQVAHWLTQQSIGTHDTVALCVSRSHAYLIWMLGIMRCGAAFVPIDPATPPQRLSYLLQDSQAKLLVCDTELESSYPGASVSTCSPAQMSATLEALPKSYQEPSPQVSAAADDNPAQRTAYVIYTSGSTGNPKGVAVSHRNLLNHAMSVAARFATDSNTRLLQSASIGFDVSMEQIFPALLRGGSVVLAPDKVLQDMSALEQTIAEQQVTHLTLPTGFWATWLETLHRSGQLLPASIRCLATGTEKVLPKHIALWDRLSPSDVKLLQGYGPTETTVTSVMYAHQRAVTGTSQPAATAWEATAPADIPIGKPLANTHLYVVDRYHQLVPADFPGELLIGGAGVAQGYLGKPEMTAERFIVNPLQTTSASAEVDTLRVYCTGDQVFWNGDGQLVFLGRQDNQFKIRGYRVEPGEIEATLAALDQVEQAAVMPVKEEHGTVKLVAYLVQQTDANWDQQRVQTALAATLPHYMVPEIVMFLDAMPLMINGKLDRKALPMPEIASAAEDLPYSEPCTEHEKILAALWQQWLQRARISRHDNFFALGGDSLRAVAIINQLKTRHQLSLSLADFFIDARLQTISEKLHSTTQISPYTIVPLNDHQRGTPIFFICGVQGYSKIAAQLTEPRPAYALFLGREMAYLSDEVEEDVNIERYALTYLDAIATVQATGPYILAGHSFGGMLAFEIARLLRQRGETVALLALLDPVLPNASYFNAAYFLKRVFQNFYRDPSLLVDQITRRLRRLNPFNTEVAYAQSATTTHRLKALRNRRYELAIDAYDAEEHPYDGDVVLFRVQEAQRQEYYRKIHPLLGWQRHVTGRILTEDLIETHEELTHKPQDIASKLDRYLAGL